MNAAWVNNYLRQNSFKAYGKFLRALLLSAAPVFLFAHFLPFQPYEICTPGPHSGAIASNQRWCQEDNPHLVTFDVQVNSNVSLTIDPGVVVRFQAGRGMSVLGSLVAVGASGQVIYFTSDQVTHTPGYWSGLQFSSSSTVQMVYVDVGYGGAGAWGMLDVFTSNLTLENASIHDGTAVAGAIRLNNAGLTPTIRNTAIQSNANHAIHQMTPDMAPVFDNLTFSGNGEDGVFLSSGAFNRNVTLDGRELGGKPFFSNGALSVNNGYTLSLSPGTTLQIGNSGGDLTVNSGATLSAVGTLTEPISITSSAPGTTFSRIFFGTNSTAILDYCDISRAAGSAGAIGIASSNIIINHSSIHNNSPTSGAIFIGYIGASGLTPTIQNTTISNNTGYAIFHYSFDIAPVYRNLVFSNNGTDAVFLDAGDFNRNITLDSRELGGKPYITGGSIGVNSGFTLTLNPGTELRFPQAGGGGSGLNVRSGAALMAQGTPAQAIIITSTGEAARYSTHMFSPGSTATLTYCDISRGAGSAGVINIQSSSVTIDHCTIHDNQPASAAIFLNAAGISPTIQNTTFQNNSSYAIYQNTPDMAPIYLNLSASGNGTDDIAINGGQLTTGRTWTIGQSTLPAEILSTINVNSAAFLSLDPGTVLLFPPNTSNGMEVYGSLYALGTTSKPVTFTGAAKTPGCWRGVNLQNTSSAILDNIEVSYGGGSLQYSLGIASSKVTLQNSKIFGSVGEGIRVFNNARPILNYNQISGNAVFGYRNTTSNTVVDATNNWWGDPSGPYHAVLNPTGLGNPVSDGVSFSPWLQSPGQIGGLPVGKVYVDLVSQTRASPGQPVTQAIWYANLSITPVENAVLVLSLPNTAVYKSSSAGGIFWPSRNQVFWKLGTLNPGDSGAVAVQVNFKWGIPDRTLEASMAVMLGNGLENGQLSPADYLNFQPYTVNSRKTLSESQFKSVLPQQPDLNLLYNQALVGGYYKGAFNQQTMSNGDVFSQALMLKPDLSEILLVTGSSNGALSYAIGRTMIILKTPTGDSITYDLQSNYILTSGGSIALNGPLQFTSTDKVNCLINCLILETGTSLLLEFAPILGKIGTISDCEAFLADPTNSESLASCAAGIQSSIPLVGTIVSAVNCYNRSLANPDYCKCTDSLWEGTTMPVTGTEACKKTPCVNGVFATYDMSVYACPTCTKCMGGSGGSNSPWDHCKPTGATPPSPCQSINTAVLPAPFTPGGQADDIFDGMKICMVIPRDPNAKFGRDGNLVPGQEVTYTITYENEGDGRAYGVYVSDVLDENLDESTLELGSNALYIPSLRKIIWTIGELGPKGDPDSKGEVLFTIHLKEGIPGGTPVFNRAIVYFPSAPEITPTNAVVNYVQGVTALPQALETSYMTPVGVTLQGVDVGGAALIYSVIQTPLFGKLTGTPPNLTYTPDANQTGQDKFTYTASNGSSASEPAEVLIVIQAAANDATPPKIQWTQPANNATAVPYRAKPAISGTTDPLFAPFIGIQFSEALDQTTLTTASLSLKDSSDHLMDFSIYYNQLADQLVLYSSEPFSDGKTYNVTLKGTITDLNHNPLGADYNFHFVTGKAVDMTYIFLPLVKNQ
jgi:hypothetical protein